jgi:parallel beta-helix repeat protein
MRGSGAMTIIFDMGEKKVNASKAIFLVVLTIISLCAVNIQPVNSQNPEGIIYISSDGSIVTSTNTTVPIQQAGDIYTFTDSIAGYYLVVQRNNIVVDGAGYYISGQGEIGVDLSGRSNVTIKNLQIGSNFYGIYLSGASGNTISGNTIAQNSYGLYLNAASQNTIIENSVTNNGYGIYLNEGSQNTIVGNNVTNNAIGINILLSSKNILRNNKMSNNYNLAVDGSEGAHFDNDIDDSNTVSGKKVYYLISQSNLVINSVTFPDVGYLALVNCQNISVHHLEITGNGHGILLAYTTNSTIYNNQITDNYYGIGLFASSNNYITTNNITHNERGVQLSNASNLNNIYTNVITNGIDGIFLFNSAQNTIVLNNVTYNNVGIGFRESLYNIIRGNHFVDNEIQVYDVSRENYSLTDSINTWDIGYPTGGNYWSDYTGVDAMSGKNQTEVGSDELGDTPYIIDQHNQDNYPLMPYGSPPAIFIDSPENKTYTVNSVSLKFTVSETTSWIKYSLDNQANVTINEDTTLSDLAFGEHSITLYTEDTDGKTGKSETVYFTIAEGAKPPQPDFSPIALIVAVIAAAVIIGVILFFFMKADKK